MVETVTSLVSCPLCGRVHRHVPLRRGERALCVRCGTTLARRGLSNQTAFAFTATAMLLAIPAMQMPVVQVEKFGAEHASYVWTGVQALWDNGMPLLSVWVALCGIAVPLMLIATLAVLLFGKRLGQSASARRWWARVGRAMQHWSMPEVHVLAVLVAFVKIGVLVDVVPGLGLWCYAAMTFATLIAWRTTNLEELKD